METQQTEQSKNGNLNENQEFENENDAKAAEFLQQAWDSIAVIDQENDLREPRKKKEIDNYEYFLNRAKELNPTNKDVLNSINDFEKYLQVWQKRKYDGSKRDLVIVSIFAILFLVGITTSTVTAIFASGEDSDNQTETSTAQMAPVDNQTNAEQSATATEASQTKTTKDAKEGRGILATILTTLLIIIFNVLWLSGFVLYYWAHKAPQWLIDKRNENPARRPISRFFARLTGAMATTTYVEKVKYSDGSTETNTDAFSGPVIALFTWIAYYGIFLMVVPLWTGLSYLKNYVWYK